MSKCCSWSILKNSRNRNHSKEDLLLEMDEFVTETQKNELIEYFETNPEQFKIVRQEDESSKENRSIWIQLAHQLNENGQMKSSKNWNIYFLSLLNDVQSTAINITTHPTNEVNRIPTKVEERLLTLANPKLLETWLIAFEKERQKLSDRVQDGNTNKRKASVDNIVTILEANYQQTLETSSNLAQAIKKVKSNHQKIAIVAPALSKLSVVLHQLAENIQEISILLSDEN